MAHTRIVNGAEVTEIPVDPAKTNEQLEREAAREPGRSALPPAPTAPVASAAAQPDNKDEYTLKGVKTFTGRDGHGLNAKLCRNGKEVAILLDEGCGGELDFDWKDMVRGESKEEARFKAFIEAERAKIPAEQKDEFDSVVKEVFDGEYWVNATVDRLETQKRMRRLCRKKTLFQVDAEVGTDAWRTIAKVGPEVHAHIRAKYQGRKVRILNEEFGG